MTDPLSLFHHHRLHLHLLLFDLLSPLFQPHPHRVELAPKKIFLARYTGGKIEINNKLALHAIYESHLGDSPLTLLGVPGPELCRELLVPMVLPLRDFGESSRSSENVMLMPGRLGITRCWVGKINIITTAVSSQRGKTCFLLFLHLSKHIQMYSGAQCFIIWRRRDDLPHPAVSYLVAGTC